VALSADFAAVRILRHVVARSRGRRPLYADPASRSAAARRLADACIRHRVICLAWCVTDRCLHFVAGGKPSSIALATDELLGSRLRHGHCLATTVQRDIYLLEVARHALDAPVRSGLVRRAIDWPHSSARESFGFGAPPAWLDPTELYDLLGPRDGKGPERLRRFIGEGARRSATPRR
jgi:putative transposase